MRQTGRSPPIARRGLRPVCFVIALNYVCCGHNKAPRGAEDAAHATLHNNLSEKGCRGEHCSHAGSDVTAQPPRAHTPLQLTNPYIPGPICEGAPPAGGGGESLTLMPTFSSSLTASKPTPQPTPPSSPRRPASRRGGYTAASPRNHPAAAARRSTRQTAPRAARFLR